MTQNRTWLTANTEYEGFPIYFRRPDVKVAEFATLQPRYPRLLIVTHVLKHVKDNGLPRSDYNASLESFDMSLTSPFNDEANGVIALIETYAGKRTYYVYIDPLFDADALIRHAKDRFPQESFSCSVEEDRGWRLFRGYAADFHFA
jgi:hypothetical protein